MQASIGGASFPSVCGSRFASELSKFGGRMPGKDYRQEARAQRSSPHMGSVPDQCAGRGGIFQ
eukprot:4066646-Karenia_brevis.AAC.1